MINLFTPPYYRNQQLISKRIEVVKEFFPSALPVVMLPFYYGIPVLSSHYLLALAPQSMNYSCEIQ
jgi:hypothetical protein